MLEKGLAKGSPWMPYSHTKRRLEQRSYVDIEMGESCGLDTASPSGANYAVARGIAALQVLRTFPDARCQTLGGAITLLRWVMA